MPPKLLISQYFEGQGADKALEITNLGPAEVALGMCELAVFTNGAITPFRHSVLSGILAAGVSYVVCAPSPPEALQSHCDAVSTTLVYNGDDALVLTCGGRILDSFGRVGEDPGEAWGIGVSTKNANLTRSCAVLAGDSAPLDAFTPDTEWTGLPLKELGDLGQHACPDAAAGGAGSVTSDGSLSPK